MKEEVVDLEANPCSGISRPGGRENPKERVLSDSEPKSLWNALKEEDPAIKHVLRLILLTGQRPGEVMGAIWDEVDLEQGLWTIPGSRTKNQLPSVVPLSPQALREFEKQKAFLENQKQKREKRGDPAPDSKYIFPNRLISKHADAPIVHIRKAVGRLHRSLHVQPFTAHDLRRTCATRLGQMRTPGHVIARILNHKPTDITSSVYNQYEYIEEKREALDAWGSKVARMISGLELIASPLAEA
jgi:integrase